MVYMRLSVLCVIILKTGWKKIEANADRFKSEKNLSPNHRCSFADLCSLTSFAMNMSISRLFLKNNYLSVLR